MNASRSPPGLMPRSEKVASLPAKTARSGLAGTGITVADIDPAARSRFGLDEAAKGALVRHVDSDSPAWSRAGPRGRRDRAGHLHAGEVPPPTPSRRSSRFRKDGRKAVMLTIDRKGRGSHRGGPLRRRVD